MQIATGLDRNLLHRAARHRGCSSAPRTLDRERPSRSPHRLSSSESGFEVEIEHQNQKHVLRVQEGESILEAALDSGLELPHDCRLGVCMTCPARLVKGEVDQSGSMLSEDVAEKGYALLCVATPESDCQIKTIDEEELLQLQLKTSEF